ncbi:MAG: L-arabinose isomerase [Fimbriimonadaceae bacterium]|nr:L-arabinose isomerase [Fimbriimonadaceae bacterium]
MEKPTLWFVTGSQHLYGPDTLRQVASNSTSIATALGEATAIPMGVIFKPIITDPDGVRALVLEANADRDCVGVILWMHTFSPAKMWIGGLKHLVKPVLHLHTQFNESLPWGTIDMDFMNLNQAAHGDREAGHLHSRIGLHRKVVVGHWRHSSVQAQIGDWARVALGWADLQCAKIARFGDNMRFVSVTDGDKVSAEAQFGFSVNGFGVGDLVSTINEVSDSEVTDLVARYSDEYEVAAELQNGGAKHDSLRYAARQEIGLRSFLTDGGFTGFTTTFEDLHGLDQLPGLACQRLMADGFGFGAEGDWKTAALLRAFKTMERGLDPGTSFMEDYTYDFTEGEEKVLGAHMLEICPSISSGRPKLEIHPLGIGGKADPVRMVFDGKTGSATNTTLVDIGSRFRLIVNEVEAVPIPPMPNLPVARALWRVKPNFQDGVAAWIYAGGAHHTVYSYNVTSEMVQDFAEIADVECVVIDDYTNIRDLRNELRWNRGAFGLRG